MSISDKKLKRSIRSAQNAELKSIKKVVRREKLIATRMGRVWYGFTQRIRWPRKNLWSGFINLERDANDSLWVRRYHYRVPAAALSVLLLISWCLIYLSLNQSIGSIRLNSFLLTNAIQENTAYAVNAVGADGSLVLKDGATYPPGSYDFKAVIQSKFGWPYYSPEQKALLIPYDWMSALKGGLQVWMWMLGTFILFWFDKLLLTRFLDSQVKGERVGMKYYEGIYAYYPRSIRLVRWGIIIVMIFCVGFLLWPLI